jgi:hypothetical protein
MRIAKVLRVSKVRGSKCWRYFERKVAAFMRKHFLPPVVFLGGLFFASIPHIDVEPMISQLQVGANPVRVQGS